MALGKKDCDTCKYIDLDGRRDEPCRSCQDDIHGEPDKWEFRDDIYLSPTYLCGLEIPFPTIRGVSQKQTWYAENLRESYVADNIDRFEEIEETMLFEADYRIMLENEWNGEHLPSFDMHLTNEERACLFSVSAKGIISALLDYRISQDQY